MDLDGGRAAEHDLDCRCACTTAIVDGLEYLSGVLEVVELVDEDRVVAGRQCLGDLGGGSPEALSRNVDGLFGRDKESEGTRERGLTRYVVWYVVFETVPSFPISPTGRPYLC